VSESDSNDLRLRLASPVESPLYMAPQLVSQSAEMTHPIPLAPMIALQLILADN